jgi:hypothetical protein
VAKFNLTVFPSTSAGVEGTALGRRLLNSGRYRPAGNVGGAVFMGKERIGGGGTFIA